MYIIVCTDCPWLIDGSTYVELTVQLHLLRLLHVGYDCDGHAGFVGGYGMLCILSGGCRRRGRKRELLIFGDEKNTFS